MPIQKRKKPEPSLAYSKTLQEDYDNAQAQLEHARLELYKHTATAKLGELPFERAREDCLKWTAEVRTLEKEIERVQRALK